MLVCQSRFRLASAVGMIRFLPDWWWFSKVISGPLTLRRCAHQRHAVLLRRSEGAATYQPGAERSAAPGTQRASTGGRASRKP